MTGQNVYINSTASIHPSMENIPEWVPGKQLQAVEPDYKTWIPNATLRRRMSRIVRMGVAAGLQCLEHATGENRPDAILTGTGLGCLADTEKFMNNFLDTEEELLTPTAFIQSTFNVIGGQIALLTGNHCYNNTYVHRGFSLESALLDASLLLNENPCAKVLVGAVDELTPTLYHILGRLGCWKETMAGEGAAFFLLAGQRTVETSARLQDIALYSGTLSAETEAQQIQTILLRNQAEGAILLHPRDYKPYCGEYPTAAAFGLWYACRLLREKNARHILLCNSFLDNHSFILLKQPGL